MRTNLVDRLNQALKVAELEDYATYRLVARAEQAARKSRVEPYEDSEWQARVKVHVLARDNLRRLQLNLAVARKFPPLEAA